MPPNWRPGLDEAIDVRVHAVFRYPPPVDIPTDLVKYARMEPLPVLRARPLPVFTE